MDDVCYLPARTLAELMRRRERSATEALRAHLDRIERHIRH